MNVKIAAPALIAALFSGCETQDVTNRQPEKVPAQTASRRTNIIPNGDFSRWKNASSNTEIATGLKRLPEGWYVRGFTREPTPGGNEEERGAYRRVQVIDAGKFPMQFLSDETPSFQNLYFRIPAPGNEVIFSSDEFPLDGGKYAFSVTAGASGRSEDLPEPVGRPIAWKIVLLLSKSPTLESSGAREITLASFTPTPEGRTFAQRVLRKSVEVPSGFKYGRIAVHGYGGSAYGMIDDLVLAK